MLSFGFKNRTFMVDFYGLMKNTVLIPTHTWSLPLLGPFSCPEVNLHKLSRFLSRDLVPGRSVDSPRKCQADSALRFALLLAAPPPAGHFLANCSTSLSCQCSRPNQALIRSFNIFIHLLHARALPGHHFTEKEITAP